MGQQLARQNGVPRWLSSLGVARRERAFARRGKGAGRSDRIGLSKGGKVASSAPSHLTCLVAVTGVVTPHGGVCDGTRTRTVMVGAAAVRRDQGSRVPDLDRQIGHTVSDLVNDLRR